MKQYPSISKVKDSKDFYGRKCYAFFKYDGSNLRFEWSKKSGWTKFGTRTRLFDASDDVFGEAVSLFLTTVAPGLEDVFKNKYKSEQKIIVFCEFVGDHSFAGTHDKDDPKKLVLFDVNIDKKGLISPKEFLDNFGHLEFAARLVYEGPLSAALVSDIEDDKLLPLLSEGVVVKGGEGHKLWMTKIKTKSYIQKLKDVFGYDNFEKYV